MSATNRGSIRVENDNYPTPLSCIELIADKINWGVVSTCCEPCAGEGAIIDALHLKEVRRQTCEIERGSDYLSETMADNDLTITNPPYLLAEEFLRKSLSHSRCTVYLLRLGFLGSKKRKEFLSRNRPSHVYVLSERPSFVDVCAGKAKTKKEPAVKGCGWSFLKSEKIDVCPNCGCNVKSGTDATDYAWIAWDRGNIMAEAPGVYFL